MDKAERLRALLQAIVQEYIQTAHPVGSKSLVTEYGFDYSPATIRNDMTVLEKAGYITQPHTSAGRIPTEKGYQYYIQHFLPETQLRQELRQAIESAFEKDITDATQQLKHVAKTIADLTNEVVVISTPTEQYYFTGMSHLFRKPEFSEVESMVAMSEVFDRLEDVMHQLQEQSPHQMQVLIGRDNPFSQECALIVSEYRGRSPGHTQQRGMIAILGPMRMNYQTNIAIIEYMESLMQQEYEEKHHTSGGRIA